METESHAARQAVTGLDRERVLARCRYFAAVSLWPTLGEGLDPEGWLRNFYADEERHALYLLNAYVYFSRRIIDRLFVESFHSLCRVVADPCQEPDQLRERWSDFNKRVVIVPVRGERPNPSDSGALFVRRARDLLAIDESRLLEPAAAVAAIEQTPDLPIVFVDDFVGSGSQMLTTWQDRREASKPSGRKAFEDLAATGTGRYYYCPVVATNLGIQTIATHAPQLVVNTGHVLSERSSALAPNSLIWPPDLADTAEDFLRVSSERAKISTNSSSTTYWKGFRGLGLTIAFEHGTPDATLPLLYWNQNGWKPLWRR
jgi:hypothetical protein